MLCRSCRSAGPISVTDFNSQIDKQPAADSSEMTADCGMLNGWGMAVGRRCLQVVLKLGVPRVVRKREKPKKQGTCNTFEAR